MQRIHVSAISIDDRHGRGPAEATKAHPPRAVSPPGLASVRPLRTRGSRKDLRHSPDVLGQSIFRELALTDPVSALRGRCSESSVYDRARTGQGPCVASMPCTSVHPAANNPIPNTSAPPIKAGAEPKRLFFAAAR